MAIDPTLIPTTPDERAAEKTANLERRLRSQETSPSVMSGPSAPTMTARDGTFFVETTTPRLYVRAGGQWRYVGLT